MGLAVVSSVGLAAFSMLVILPAPSYDPWAWLLWGREVAGGELNTLEGPAFKPLAVAIGAVLSWFGSAAPWLWVLLARTAAALAIWLAFRLGRRLGGGSLVAGVLAAAAVALCGYFLGYAASGVVEGMLLALALTALEAWRAGRARLSIACAVACGLLRVETWPFLIWAAAVTWRCRPQYRPLVVTAALLVPAAWFVPEMIGSGDPLRSAARARVPNPGNPALAAVPALESLREAAAVPPWPVWGGLAVLVWQARAKRDRLARAALAPAAAGFVWVGLVAVMAQGGFSGQGRYALPGAALVALSGGVGLARATALARSKATPAAVASVLMVLAAAPRAAELSEVRAAQAHQWHLHSDLSRAVAAMGGGESVLACGRPYVGPVRGPLTAWHLHVAKHVVEPDEPPTPPGVVFRSSFSVGEEARPVVPPGFDRVVSLRTWEVYSSC